ncbi:MAG: hypothetical protein SVK08_00500 [Halobacteriota archaeon]|nr:hypothetical protein [Halobacteriota archaeon]
MGLSKTEDATGAVCLLKRWFPDLNVTAGEFVIGRPGADPVRTIWAYVENSYQIGRDLGVDIPLMSMVESNTWEGALTPFYKLSKNRRRNV